MGGMKSKAYLGRIKEPLKIRIFRKGFLDARYRSRDVSFDERYDLDSHDELALIPTGSVRGLR